MCPFACENTIRLAGGILPPVKTYQWSAGALYTIEEIRVQARASELRWCFLMGTRERELVRRSRADWIEHKRGCWATHPAATRCSAGARYASDGDEARGRT